MQRKHIINIIKKEWYLITKDPNSTMMITLLPLLILGQAILYVWLIDKFGGQAISQNSFFLTVLEKLQNVYPALTDLSPSNQLKFLFLTQFNLYLLLIPTMIAMNSAAFSIVEEKMSKSLEPLLATPVTTRELLIGKALSGAIPALIITWICAIIFIAAIFGIGWSYLIGILLTPSWFISLLILTPAITLLSFLLGVIGSARAHDARNAQNGALLIILPIFLLIALQVTGIIWFTAINTLLFGLVLIAIDYLVLRFAVRLFNRESIVVNWQ
jgi:ABC-2 type transport system permease protein